MQTATSTSTSHAPASIPDALQPTDNITYMSDFLAQLAKELEAAQHDSGNTDDGPSNVTLLNDPYAPLPRDPGLAPPFGQYPHAQHSLHPSLHGPSYYPPTYPNIHREMPEAGGGTRPRLMIIIHPQFPILSHHQGPKIKASPKTKVNGRKLLQKNKRTQGCAEKSWCTHANIAQRHLDGKAICNGILEFTTGERPFVCSEPGCGKNFIQVIYLYNMLLLTTKRSRCIIFTFSVRLYTSTSERTQERNL